MKVNCFEINGYLKKTGDDKLDNEDEIDGLMLLLSGAERTKQMWELNKIAAIR